MQTSWRADTVVVVVWLHLRVNYRVASGWGGVGGWVVVVVRYSGRAARMRQHHTARRPLVCRRTMS